MLGPIVNFFAIIIGSGVGLLFKKGVPEKYNEAVMIGLGLCTAFVGIDGMLVGDNVLVCILSMVLGAIVGTALDIDAAINRLGDKVGEKFKSDDSTVSVAEGFVTATLLVCIGAMAIVGSLNSGLTGDHEVLFTKSLLDLIYTMMITVSLGFGVMLSAFAVLIFEGSIVLLAGVIAPILTDSAIAEMTSVGSVMIFALGLNIVGITKIKVANYLPAVFFAVPVCILFEAIM